MYWKTKEASKKNLLIVQMNEQISTKCSLLLSAWAVVRNRMTRTREDMWVELCFVSMIWLKENTVADLRRMYARMCHPISTFQPVTHYYESWNKFHANGRHPNIIHFYTVRNNVILDAWAIEVGVMLTTCLGRKMRCGNKSWK